MIPYAFASLAHVQVLLLPVGQIPRAIFDAYAAEIRTFESIRLGDIPGDAKDERARFMPSPLSSGYLHLSFPSHPSLPAHSPLSLFRPSHFNLGIIGIAVCSSSHPSSSALEQFENTLADIYPEHSTFPLAKTCFAFQDDDEPNVGLGENHPSLAIIPNAMGNKKLYIGTLLADLCSQILGEFGHLVHTLETPLGNEYLNGTLFPTLPAAAEMPFALDSSTFPTHSTQSELVVSHLSTPVSNGMTRSSPGLGVLHGSTAVLQRHSSLGPSTVKKRVTAVGTTSSHARLFKLYGDLFLLAGRPQDARIWYQEALNSFKTGMDPVWQASAMEGLAVISVLDSWAAGQGLASISDTKDPWMEINEQLSQAVAIYLKASVPSDAVQDYSLLAFVYTSAVLRQTSLLFCVWSSKGWGPFAFASMLQPGATSYWQKVISDNSWVNLERLSAITSITRSQIANTVSQAHGPWLLHLGLPERLVVLQSMANIYSCMGYRRKEAYVLREVISCIMDLVVCGRDEDYQLRRSDVGSAGLAVRTAGLQNGDDITPTGNGSLAFRPHEKMQGNQSVLRVLTYACRALGVDVESVNVAAPPNAEEDNTDPDIIPFEAMSLAESLNNSFGWPELQVGVMREAIAVAEALPDQLAVARFALSALKSMHSILPANDQSHLYQTASRALAIIRRRGDASMIEYWAGHPIQSIAVLPLPLHRIPAEKPRSLLATSSSTPHANKHRTGPSRRPVLIQPPKNELAELVITLRNPFVFDLELHNVSLITSGVEVECSTISSIMIPANSIHAVTVSATAKKPGVLTVKGCTVHAFNGAPKRFFLPVSTEAEEEHQSRRHSMMLCESGRTKYSGLDARPWDKGGKHFTHFLLPSKLKTRFLECVVVPEQPLLRLRWTSLTHAAVMLYNGEKSTIRLTLENVSALPIDFLTLSFEDSTIAPAQEALADGQLDVFETYETEYDLIHQRAFSWNRDKEIKVIDPGQKIVVSVACFGKAKCTGATVRVSYAHARQNDESGATPEIFYTRQLTYPMTVTVYHMLECHNMNVMPLDAFSDIGDDALWRDSDPHEWCLFSIEVRNTYGLPFEVTFDRTQQDAPDATTRSIVPPGSTSRILLPIRRFRLSDDVISRRTPILSDRQFVVSKSSLTDAEDKIQRELFWYREELLHIIRARWKEVNSANGSRHGDLSLRQQCMTMHMLNALKTDLTRIDLSLAQCCPEEPAVTLSGGKFIVASNTVVSMVAKITNTGPSPLAMMLDVSTSPEEHVLLQGSLTDIALGRVESGQSRIVEVPLCFLSVGYFEIAVEARQLGVAGEKRRTGVARLWARVKENDSLRTTSSDLE
ncbi:TRAPP II complex [Boletus reticuloceps]|uniref:TRAPP II complex n=1 Tax=Boletus reticuloceps TaxID=495285 RepID=A0A8I3A8U2_9AGAM|nr:TRAPP II complex [Boletus reticuloceps]